MVAKNYPISHTRACVRVRVYMRVRGRVSYEILKRETLHFLHFLTLNCSLFLKSPYFRLVFLFENFGFQMIFFICFLQLHCLSIVRGVV